MKYNSTFFEKEEYIEQAQFILSEYSSECLLDEETSEQELDTFVEAYNWDDGFIIPYFIMVHPKCSLGIALKMFYLGDGLGFFEDDFYDYFYEEYIVFIEQLYYKLIQEEFSLGTILYQVPLNGMMKKKLRNDHPEAGIIFQDIG